MVEVDNNLDLAVDRLSCLSADDYDILKSLDMSKEIPRQINGPVCHSILPVNCSSVTKNTRTCLPVSEEDGIHVMWTFYRLNSHLLSQAMMTLCIVIANPSGYH